MYTEKVQVTSGRFHGIPRESVAKLICTLPDRKVVSITNLN